MGWTWQNLLALTKVLEKQATYADFFFGWGDIFVNFRLRGLVVRVSDYIYRGLGFDSRRYQIF